MTRTVGAAAAVHTSWCGLKRDSSIGSACPGQLPRSCNWRLGRARRWQSGWRWHRQQETCALPATPRATHLRYTYRPQAARRRLAFSADFAFCAINQWLRSSEGPCRPPTPCLRRVTSPRVMFPVGMVLGFRRHRSRPLPHGPSCPSPATHSATIGSLGPQPPRESARSPRASPGLKGRTGAFDAQHAIGHRDIPNAIHENDVCVQSPLLLKGSTAEAEAPAA